MRAEPDRIDHYAVIGHPARHSLSPRLHGAFARLTGQTLDYRAIELDPAEFESFWDSDAGRGLAGANITLPFKERAFELVDDIAARAAEAGAVNTIIRAHGRLHGDNTDGEGLVRDLTENLRWSLAGSILILGAGGAARGAIAALRQLPGIRIVVANRTLERAETLAERFPGLSVRRPDQLGPNFIGIVNATATGHAGQRPALAEAALATDPWCYDLSYGSAAAPFLGWCRSHGVTRRSDGLGMLVEQGAESFRIWRGVRPPTAPVIAELRGDQDR